MLVGNIQEEKNKINLIISNGIQEILKKGLSVAEKSLGSLEDDIGIMLRALQLKNKIYDYAVFIKYNELLKRFEGRVAYSLINTENMTPEEQNKWEVVLDFNF
jgi:hypothetical protein